MRVCLSALARPQAEEEGDLDEVGLSLGKGSIDVVRLRRGHDESQQDVFFPLRQQILIREVAEHPH